MADEQIDIVESSLEKPKKKQVSAKVMENLRKAQARKKELDEEKKKMSSEKKKQLAKERQITRLAKKLDTLKDSLPPTIIERSSSSSQNKIEAPKAPKKAKPPPPPSSSESSDSSSSDSDSDVEVVVLRKRPPQAKIPKVKKEKPLPVAEKHIPKPKEEAPKIMFA